MPRAKKRKVNKRNVVILGLSVLLLIILTCFLKRALFPRVPVYYMTEDWNGDSKTEFQKDVSKRDWYCPDLQSIIKKVQKHAPIEKIEVANKNNRSFQFIVNLLIDGPYIGIDADESIAVYLKQPAVTGFRSLYVEKLQPDLFRKGFTRETLTDVKFNVATFGSEMIPSDEATQTQYFHSGLKKDLITYVLQYEENEQKVIYISCRKISDRDINTLGVVASIFSYSDWKTNTLVQVWGELMDNVIKLNITQIEGGSGHSEWWTHNASGSWTLLTSGQDDPECYLFEKQKVGKGIECIRKNTAGNYEESTADY